MLREIFTSFGSLSNRPSVGKNEFQSAEHYVGVKLGSLRLGKTVVILTRTRNTVSLGLISQRLQTDLGLPYLVAPMITFEIKEIDALVPRTPHSQQVFALIASYCAPLFTTVT